jgi:carotenoid 1,2-hydratase
VANGGYAWWYLDALSDDGRHALTVIAFIGSVFSPYYAWARRRAPQAARASAHNAINVALYGPGSHHWTMTERGERQLQRDARTLCIGPSALAWHDGALTLQIDEVTAPWPRHVRGHIRLTPQACCTDSHALDAAGRHQWSPIAPVARVEAEFEQPRLRWQGAAYLDSNRGSVPLEDDFERWDWSRCALPDGRGAVLYDVTTCGGAQRSLALAFNAQGRSQPFDAPPPVALPRSGWRVERGTRCDAGAGAQVQRTLEDGPFYARSMLRTQLLGEPAQAVHESLSLRRFASPVVQAMLPFRMPRRAG